VTCKARKPYDYNDSKKNNVPRSPNKVKNDITVHNIPPYIPDFIYPVEKNVIANNTTQNPNACFSLILDHAPNLLMG